MSYTSLLIDTCTIERFGEGAADAYGKPAITWSDHLTEACRLQAGVGKELTIGAEVVVADYKLFLGDVDVTEQDRAIVEGVTYQILLVMNRSNGVDDHHKECLMRAVR